MIRLHLAGTRMRVDLSPEEVTVSCDPEVQPLKPFLELLHSTTPYRHASNKDIRLGSYPF